MPATQGSEHGKLARRPFVQLAFGCVTFAWTAQQFAFAQQGQLAPSSNWREKLIAAARAQIGVTRSYDPAYTAIPFPGGDVPREKGVCTDVIVRAYRDAFGLDLQALVNADMRAHFSDYPKAWGLKRPDPNIDHRRVLNLAAYFTRHRAKLAGAAFAPTEAQPGDLVTQLLPGNLPHIGIVSDKGALDGRFLMIHNIGAGAEESDVLATYALTGRYALSPTT
jgi:uncharacterized protein YijF (DUF1287 family)